MRLVALTLGALVALGGAARAEDSFVAKTQIYVDSDHTTVVSPLVHIAKDAWQGATIGAGFVADVVSSASVDVVSNATQHMSDLRKQVSAGLTQKVSATTISASYIFSSENDYTSHNLVVGLSQDLLQRNLTLALNYALSLNDVGRSGDPSFHRELDVHTVDASITQVLDKRTIASLAYTFSYNTGYQASPYRFVHVESTPDFKVPETDPNERLRHAFVLALNRHVGKDSSVGADVRLYLDDWGVTSFTQQLRYFVNFGNVTLRLRERFYYQTDASFFQPHYQQVQSYITADRELSNFWELLGGLKLQWRLPGVAEGLSLEAKADVFYFSYLDFDILNFHERVGANLEAGLTFLY